MPSPDRATVLAQAAAGSSFIPIWRTWPADLETPLTTWLKVGAGSDHGVLLESVEGGERVGRFRLFLYRSAIAKRQRRRSQPALHHP